MGALVALDQAWIAYSVYSPGREDTWIHMLVAMLAISVAMLGPGAWSIDARLFGRQRIESIEAEAGNHPSKWVRGP